MRSELKYRIDRLGKKQTIKHLRGQHDQRDHAWNRGMGGGGSSGYYGPGYMNTQQFLALKASLQAQIAAGSITQEEGEATWTAVQRIHNEDYDNRKRAEQELSRRESTVETLANRRRRNNTASRLTANDISFNTSMFDLANVNNYAGQGFLSFWDSINTSAENFTQAEIDGLNQEYDSVYNSRQNLMSYYDQALKVGFFDELSAPFEILPTRMVLDELSQILQQMGDMFASTIFDDFESAEEIEEHIRLAEQGLYEFMESAKYANNIVEGEDLATLMSETKKRLEKTLAFFEKLTPEMYTIADEDLADLEYAGYEDANRINEDMFRRSYIRFREFNDSEKIEKAIRSAQNYLKFKIKMMNPQVWFAMHAAFASKRPLDASTLISRNAATVLPRLRLDNLFDGSTDIDITDENFSQYVAAALLRQMSIGDGEISGTVDYDSAIVRKLIDEVVKNENYANELRQAYFVPPSFPMSNFSPIVPLFLTGDSDNLISYFESHDPNVMGNEIKKEILEKIRKETNNSSGGRYMNPDDYDVIKRVMQDAIDNMNESLSIFSDNPITSRTGLDAINKIIRKMIPNAVVEMLGAETVSQMLILSSQRHNTTTYSQSALSEMESIITREREIAEQERIRNLPYEERYAAEIERLNNLLNDAIARNDDTDIEMYSRELDNRWWDNYQNDNPNLFINSSRRQRIRLQLAVQPFRSENLRNGLQAAYNRELENQEAFVDTLYATFQRSTTDDNFSADNKFLQYIKAEIELQREKGMSDNDLGVHLAEIVRDNAARFPDVNFTDTTNYINNLLGSSINYTPGPDIYERTRENREKAWGKTQPVLIEEGSEVNPEDSVFGSPAFAYGNPIADPYNKTDQLPPDNPDEVPLFNPKYARFGARELIDTLESDPKSLFDYQPGTHYGYQGQGPYDILSPQKQDIVDKLEKLGYSQDLIDSILENLNDKLVAMPRDDVAITMLAKEERDTITDETRNVSLVISYVCSNPLLDSSGTITIDFQKEPSKTKITKYVGFMRIPELEGGQSTKYKGASGPILMYSADQMRRIGYALGTNQVYYKAQAANIDNRDAGQNSGPTTWPVLGATTFVDSSTRLKAVLLQMGYTKEFIEYVGQLGKVPSYLFFLNAPPTIFVTRPDPNDPKIKKQVQVNTTTQALWSEIYGSAIGVNASYDVLLNVGTPNDPGRLFNLMIPGAKKPSTKEEKELVQLSRVKSIIKNFKMKRYRYAEQ